MTAKGTSGPREGELVVTFKSVGDMPIKEIFGDSPLRLAEMQDRLWNFVREHKLDEEYTSKGRQTATLKR